MCNLPLILAATLSLSSTNDYVFTTPMTTNLLGVGLGTSAAYAVPRIEDIAFLREAYAERERAIGSPYTTRAIWPSGGAVLDEGRMFASPGQVYDLWPLSTGRWMPRYNGYSGGFVTGDSSIDPGANYGMWGAIDEGYVGPDFAVNGISTDKTNGLAFVTTTTSNLWAVPLAALATNGWFEGAVKLQTLAGAYTNLLFTGAVLGTKGSSRMGEVRATTRTTLEGWTEVDHYTTSPYTYTDSTGVERTDYYNSSYTLKPRSTETRYVATNTIDIASGLQISARVTSHKELPAGNKIAGPPGPRHYEVVPLGVYYAGTESRVQNRPIGDNRITLWDHPCLTTSAVYRAELITNVEFFIVSRFRCEMRDMVYGDTDRTFETNYVERYIVEFHKDDAEYLCTTNGYHVFRSIGSWDYGEILWSVFDQGCDGIPSPSSPPDPISPQYAEYPYASYTTDHRQTRTLKLVDVFVYPLIHRRYNAYFED